MRISIKLALFILFPTILGAQEYGQGPAFVIRCTIFEYCDLDLSCENSDAEKFKKHLFMIVGHSNRAEPPSKQLYWISEDGGVFEPVKMVANGEEFETYRNSMDGFSLRKIITPTNVISDAQTYDIYDIYHSFEPERAQNLTHIVCGNPIGNSGGQF